MSKGFNQARCELVARREGISYFEAAKRIGASGARKRKQKQAQRINASIEAKRPLPWYLRDLEED
jgi:hypothetical protein